MLSLIVLGWLFSGAPDLAGVIVSVVCADAIEKLQSNIKKKQNEIKVDWAVFFFIVYMLVI